MSDTHIKIKPVVPKVQYTGNGVTTVFPYEFAIFDESDMVVYFDDEVQESGYSISGAGETDGGNVTFDVAPDDGVKITLIRNIAIERLTDFQEGGTLRAKNLNDEFDRQTAFAQQVAEELSRSVKVGPTSDVNPETVLTQVERIYSSIDNVDAVADDISNVNSVASNSTNINTCASNMSAITGAPTQAANAAASASASADSAALSAQYANDKINQTHISNCLTYIPQDIKLELNNGTLTLKAGSKVYGGYELLDTIEEDVNLTWNYTGTFLYSYCPEHNSIVIAAGGAESVYSLPTPASTHKLFFNKYNGKCYYDDNNTVMVECSLPIAVCTANSGIKSIDIVFNGFGYIADTVFVLPGVKGLIPDGRNADGTLKSIAWETKDISVETFANNRTGFICFQIDDTERIASIDNQYNLYNQTTNKHFNTYNNTTIKRTDCGILYVTNGVISNFNSKTTFHALDYNDKGTITGWAMPSNKYIDLTLGTSGATYTAPGNGSFCLRKEMSTNFEFIEFTNTTTGEVKTNTNIGGNADYGTGFKCAKGDVVAINYTASGATTIFKFIYSKGDV